MKQMIINTSHEEETRIAIMKNEKLVDIDLENVDREQKKSNIYKARICRIEPSLNAVFVNYGEDKNGFLPYKEISTEYFKKDPKDENNQNVPLNELLDVKQEIIVQISKEERGNKGAALTTFITLAGCYMVLMPNSTTEGGISRRIEGSERAKLKLLFDSLKIPKGMGVIIRTAGVDRSSDEIQWDLDSLIKLWDAIKSVSQQKKASFLIHKESDITVRAIRDHLKEDIEKIVIDTKEGYDDLKRQLKMLRPGFVDKLELYEENIPLFSKYKIEKQIENTFKREIHLSSGGSIVIDTTEALIAIDVNSARSTKSGTIEETAFNTNMEAAEEIALQLRLRDLGGLIIVDFIDMQFPPNKKAVEQKLIDSLQGDRAKIQMVRISKFSLVEISRQRLQSSLNESVMQACPRCHGHGFIRTIVSLSLSILRNIRTEAIKEKTNEVRVQLPLDVAAFLLNEKRDEIVEIEALMNVKIILIPNSNLHTPSYNIQRIWGDTYSTNRESHNLIEDNKEVILHKTPVKNKNQIPAIKSAELITEAPSNIKEPEVKKVVKKNIFAKISNFLFGEDKQPEVKKPEVKKPEVKKPNLQKKEIHNNKNKKPIQNNSATPKQPENKRQQDLDKKNIRPNNNKKDTKEHSTPTNSTSNSSYKSKSSRLQVHLSEEMIDIESKRSVVKKDLSIEERSKKTISTSPEEKISFVVKDILESYYKNADSENTIKQVETISKRASDKLLKFKIIDISNDKNEKVHEISKKEDVASKIDNIEIASEKNEANTAAIDESVTNVDNKPKQARRKKVRRIEYSPSLDSNRQGYIVAKTNYRNRKNKKTEIKSESV